MVLKTDSQYYRTFIALPVSVGREVLDARSELMKQLAGERISWVKPDRYHVTLRFIGDTERSNIPGIREVLRREVTVPQSSNIQLTQPGSFGPRKKPRVIWLGFKQTALFEKLKTDVDRALEKCGIPVVDQSFRAHLTLGRVRSLKDLSHFYDVIEQMQNRINESVWLDRLVFYRSNLGPDGPVYTMIDEIRFR